MFFGIWIAIRSLVAQETLRNIFSGFREYPLRFVVLPHGQRRPREGQDVVYLLTDAWDDWFKYSTMYAVYYFDEDGEGHSIGEVKIGSFDMPSGQRRPDLPEEFTELGQEFFSVGQDDTYYEKLNDLGPAMRATYLNAMRDMALDADRYERALAENVTGVSLLRYVSDKTVRGQFHRMATGGARLTSFSFSYRPCSRLPCGFNRRSFSTRRGCSLAPTPPRPA